MVSVDLGMINKNKNIENIDGGKNYGKQKLLNSIVYSYNNFLLNYLVKEIRQNYKTTDEIRIADWGGANSILTLDLLDLLPEYNKIKIYNVDIDSTKFIKHEKITNIKANANCYNFSRKVHYSVARNIFHYIKNKSTFLRNVYNNTINKFLLINFVFDKKNRTKWSKFEKIIRTKLKVKRFFSDQSEVLQVITDNGWKIKSRCKISIKNFDFKTFYINRFLLNRKQINIFEKQKIFPWGDYNLIVFLLFKKE